MSKVKVRKVTRYFWNGKGYPNMKSASMAAARMEMSIYVHLYAKEYFKSDIGNIPRYPDEDTSKDLEWSYAAAYLTDSWQGTSLFDPVEFTYIGEDDDLRPWLGHGSHYRTLIESRAKSIADGDDVIVEKVSRFDPEYHWTERWEFTDANKLVELGFPYAEEMLSLNGSLIVQEFKY